MLDLVCPTEAQALTDEQVRADDVAYRAYPAGGHPNEDAFNLQNLKVARECHDTLRRNCLWHKERGADVDCDKLLAVAG